MPFKMEKTDYLSELKKPHLQLSDVSDYKQVDMDMDKYADHLEDLRFSFVESISSCRENVACAYLNELAEIKKEIERAIAAIRDRNARSYYAADIPFPHNGYRLHFLDALMDSLMRTTTFLGSISDNELSKKKVIVEAGVNDIIATSPISEINNDIIKGVKGLAQYLGCGLTKAQTIINSKILLKEGIQWSAGGWRFDAKKLQEYRANNPTAFDNLKCPH